MFSTWLQNFILLMQGCPTRTVHMISTRLQPCVLLMETCSVDAEEEKKQGIMHAQFWD